MASENLNPTNIVDRMRLNTGDFIEDEPYLSDAIYLYFYQEAGNSIIDGSIQALESIINNIALSPQSWTIGAASETGPLITALEARLNALRSRRSGNKVPVILHTDRKNWNDFNKAFGNPDYYI